MAKPTFQYFQKKKINKVDLTSKQWWQNVAEVHMEIFIVYSVAKCTCVNRIINIVLFFFVRHSNSSIRHFLKAHIHVVLAIYSFGQMIFRLGHGLNWIAYCISASVMRARFIFTHIIQQNRLFVDATVLVYSRTKIVTRTTFSTNLKRCDRVEWELKRKLGSP